MCGFAGYVDLRRTALPDSVLVRMTEAIRHRGPDDSGYYRDSVAALGHQRLTIIDTSAGRQPLPNENESHWIVYNGEIYNHLALRSELERAGHAYTTRTDTESILHAYEEHGVDVLSRLRGMFSFAIWDKNSSTLFCARDRLGIKPFYYFWDGSLFAFASEIKALLRHPDIGARLDESRLPEYLAFGYNSDDRTLFRGVRKLMPGHSLMLRRRHDRLDLEIRQYWDVPEPQPEASRNSEADWIAECRALLEESVRLRLMSDVPLGMFLSGGVDSSAIAALMSGMMSEPVKTFAVGYRETSFSELDYARLAASHLGTDHREVLVGPDDFFGSLPTLIGHEDEPITWPSSVSLYFVSKLASQHVKVVLTGEGSDELFAGYTRYRFHALNQKGADLYRLVPAPLRRWVRAQVGVSPLLSANLRRRLGHTFLGRDADLPSLYLDNFYSAFPHDEQASLLLDDQLRCLSPYRNYLGYWDKAAAHSLIARLLYADQKTYLVELLMKQDQMSMAASIESRVPFLDHHLVEFAVRVPNQLKTRGAVGKYILKRAVEDLLPRRIVHRNKKGFPTPIRQWLFGPDAEPMLASLRSRGGLLASCLDLNEVNSLLIRHQSGQEDATDRIWRLLNLQIWGDVFLGAKAAGWFSDAAERAPVPPRA